MNNKVTSDQIILALNANAGLICHASDALGICRQTIWKRSKTNKKIQEAIDNSKERNLDLAESVVMHHLKEKSLSAAMYYLNNKGYCRGYVGYRKNNIDEDNEHVDKINIEVVDASKQVIDECQKEQ